MHTVQGIIGGGYLLASVLLIILAATRKNFPGKAWFIAFLALGLASKLAWQLPPLLLRFDLPLWDMPRFFEVWGISLNLIGLAGFCLLIPFLFAVANSLRQPGDYPAVDVPDDAPPAGDTANPLYGVAGWLKFFVVVNLYIAPVLFGIQQIFAFIGFGMLAEDYPGLVVVGLIETAAGIFFVVKWIMIARRLRDMVPGVVQEAKRWLLITLAWNVLGTLLVLLSGVDAESVMFGAMKGLITGVISFAIWYSYFNVSKRVRATYAV
jgi:hypothetical protein